MGHCVPQATRWLGPAWPQPRGQPLRDRGQTADAHRRCRACGRPAAWGRRRRWRHLPNRGQRLTLTGGAGPDAPVACRSMRPTSYSVGRLRQLSESGGTCFSPAKRFTRNRGAAWLIWNVAVSDSTGRSYGWLKSAAVRNRRVSGEETPSYRANGFAIAGRLPVRAQGIRPPLL